MPRWCHFLWLASLWACLQDISDAIKSAREEYGASLAVPSAGLGDAQLAAVATAADLEVYGPDVLKAALTARGLKSGGTLADRAERLLSVRGLTPAQYPKKLLCKPVAGAATTGGAGEVAAVPVWAAGLPACEGRRARLLLPLTLGAAVVHLVPPGT